MNIDKSDKAHLKLINKAIRENNSEQLSLLMNNKVYSEDYLRKSFLQACANGNLDIISFLMTSKTFSPNQLSVRGLDEIFRNKHEDVINWLIFDYTMHKSGAIEEVLIEMNDQNYAKHIANLFDKREFNNQLNQKLLNKEVNIKNPSHKIKI